MGPGLRGSPGHEQTRHELGRAVFQQEQSSAGLCMGEEEVRAGIRAYTSRVSLEKLMPPPEWLIHGRRLIWARRRPAPRALTTHKIGTGAEQRRQLIGPRNASLNEKLEWNNGKESGAH